MVNVQYTEESFDKEIRHNANLRMLKRLQDNFISLKLIETVCTLLNLGVEV